MAARFLFTSSASCIIVISRNPLVSFSLLNPRKTICLYFYPQFPKTFRVEGPCLALESPVSPHTSLSFVIYTQHKFFKTSLDTFFYIHGAEHRESNLIVFQQDATYSAAYRNVIN